MSAGTASVLTIVRTHVKMRHMETTTAPTFGQRYDVIADRMDAAYAERRKCKSGTTEYEAADEAIEAVYADLRVLNAEVRAR